jgi:tetratricopeptide (TPR) repeat protein
MTETSPRARLRTAGWAVLLVGVLGICWWSPRSPVALERGDVLVGLDRTADAAAHYDAVAEHNPLQRIRHRAAFRAAALWSIELSEPGRAKARLEALGDDEAMPGPVRARALAEVGELLLTTFDDPASAARAFKLAYDLDPTAGEAADRLGRAARAQEIDGKPEEAHRTWALVSRHFPARKAEARINQAAILLGKGQLSQALEAYEDAIAAATDEEDRQAARIGATACRERQARIEAALAAIEAEQPEGLPVEVRSSPANGLPLTDAPAPPEAEPEPPSDPPTEGP